MKRALVTADHPSESPSAAIPVWDADFDEGQDFLEAEDLTALGRHLIQKHRELNFIAEYRVRFLWKAEGGESRGRPTLGRCVLANAMVKHFADSDWVIWLAADHCENSEMTDHQVEALLYHELLHCALKGRDGDLPGIRGHDYEIFGAEIRRYGLWEDGLESLAAITRAAEDATEYLMGLET